MRNVDHAAAHAQPCAAVEFPKTYTTAARRRHRSRHLASRGSPSFILRQRTLTASEELAAALHRAMGASELQQARALIQSLQRFLWRRDVVLKYEVAEPTQPAILKFVGRQREVLQALIDGHTEKQVAQRLDISVNTVHHYVKEIYRRLNVRSRGELHALVRRS